MENNLSKAISQIKFPVRYDDKVSTILDADGIEVLAVYLIPKLVKYTDAFGHALAEMINGLDGRGNGWISVEERLPDPHKKVIVFFGEYGNTLLGIMDSSNEWSVFWADGHKQADNERPITHWMPLPAPPNSKPDRQVCDLCGNTGWEKDSGDRCICVRKWDEGYGERVSKGLGDRQVKSAEETLVQYLERRFVTADGVIEWNEQVRGLIEKWK